MSGSRLHWVLAQLGRKPGGAQVLAQLLGPADLPGPGWRLIDERTWRTGRDGTADWQQRARVSGSVTAWRSFEQTGGDRWLWMQVTPLVDEADAASALSAAPDLVMRNLRAEVRLSDEREVPPPVPLTTTTAWAFEQRAEGETGESLSLVLMATTGRSLIILAGYGVSRPWGWEEIAALEQLQAARLDG